MQRMDRHPMYPYRRPTVWFYVGLVALTVAIGPWVFGFLAIITWGVILIPFVFLIAAAPVGALNYALWKRPLVAVVALLLIGSAAFLLWPEQETYPRWEYVPVGNSGRMDLRFVDPANPNGSDLHGRR